MITVVFSQVEDDQTDLDNRRNHETPKNRNAFCVAIRGTCQAASAYTSRYKNRRAQYL